MGSGTADAEWVVPMRSDADEEKRVGQAARDGIAGNYKRLRTWGLSPQQLLVASTPTTALPLTTMSAYPCSTSARPSSFPWTHEHNGQWDL